MQKKAQIRQLRADLAYHQLEMKKLAVRCDINYEVLRQSIYLTNMSEARLARVRAKLDEMIAEATTAQSEPAA